MTSTPNTTRPRNGSDENTPAPVPALERGPWTKHRAEVLLLGAAVVLSALVSGWFASRSSWLYDDFLIFQDAQRGGYDLGYLGSEAILAFAPGHRLVTLVLYRHATFDFETALAVLMLVQAVGVVLVQRIVRWFAGPVWWSYALAFAYGASIITLSSLQWFSAGLRFLPAATLSLAAIHAYLCWRRSGHRGWLVWSALAVAGALLFYEKAIFVPLYLLLIRVLLLDQHRPVFENVRAAVREWRVWAPYAVVCVVWLALYRTRSYREDWEFGSIGDNLKALRISYFESYVPGALGVRVTGAGGHLLRAVTVIGGQLLVLATVVASVRRRRAAWRAWALLAIVFLIGFVPLLARVSMWGPEDVGHKLRYQTEMLLLTPVALAAAFGRRGAVVRCPPVLGAVAVLAFAAATLASASAITGDWPGDRSKRFLANVRTDVGALQRAGISPSVLDEGLPEWLVPGWTRRGKLSLNLPLFLDGLRFNAGRGPTYKVGGDGHLQEVRFEARLGGDARALLEDPRVTFAGSGRPRVTDRGLCLRGDGGLASLELAPATTIQAPHPLYLRATYSTSPGAGVFLDVDRGLGYPAEPDRGLPPGPDGNDILVELGSLPGASPKFGGIRATVAQNAVCLKRFEVGTFSP